MPRLKHSSALDLRAVKRTEVRAPYAGTAHRIRLLLVTERGVHAASPLELHAAIGAFQCVGLAGAEADRSPRSGRRHRAPHPPVVGDGARRSRRFAPRTAC